MSDPSMSFDQHTPFLKPVPPARFKRNFLQQVVCELRFPTLFDLNSVEPDRTFARAVRKAYPNHNLQVTEVNVDGASVERTHVHIFKSLDLSWTVTLRPSAITIETSKYTSFAELAKRIKGMLDIAPDVIDSNFFTRLGLRYINAIPMQIENKKLDKFEGWVRPDLTSVLIKEDLGVLHEYSGRFSGSTEFGGFLFQHGVGKNQTSAKFEYLLDFDFWKQNVEIDQILESATTLHQNQFAMFMWSLGPNALEYLGPSILKGRENV